MSLTSATLIERNAELWHAATRHEFLDCVRDGTVPVAAFSRWLEQDYLFVAGLTRAWGRLLVGAPQEDFKLIASGIDAFSSELEWFEALAGPLAVRLDREPLPETSAYIEDLVELATRPYAVAITGMWGVEVAYLHAWRGASGGDERFAGVVEHWANAEFATFVGELEAVVDRELAASPEHHHAVEQALAVVLSHEELFWGLAGLE
jgi:thiaminase